jgi:serine/threonine protein kinase
VSYDHFFSLRKSKHNKRGLFFLEIFCAHQNNKEMKKKNKSASSVRGGAKKKSVPAKTPPTVAGRIKHVIDQKILKVYTSLDKSTRDKLTHPLLKTITNPANPKEFMIDGIVWVRHRFIGNGSYGKVYEFRPHVFVPGINRHQKKYLLEKHGSDLSIAVKVGEHGDDAAEELETSIQSLKKGHLLVKQRLLYSNVNGFTAYAMQLMDGDLHDLKKKSEQGRFALDEAFVIISSVHQSILSLSDLKKSLYYTDIKPDNILFKQTVSKDGYEEYKIRLGDLGSTSSDMVMTYPCPEFQQQQTKTKSGKEKCIVWMIGLLLVYLVSDDKKWSSVKQRFLWKNAEKRKVDTKDIAKLIYKIKDVVTNSPEYEKENVIGTNDIWIDYLISFLHPDPKKRRFLRDDIKSVA